MLGIFPKQIFKDGEDGVLTPTNDTVNYLALLEGSLHCNLMRSLNPNCWSIRNQDLIPTLDNARLKIEKITDSANPFYPLE